MHFLDKIKNYSHKKKSIHIKKKSYTIALKLFPVKIVSILISVSNQFFNRDLSLCLSKNIKMYI